MRANGQICGAPLVLTRSDYGAALDLLLRQPAIATATRTAILALEHVHHGDFWSGLSPSARAALRQVAQDSGLQALLPAPDPLPPPAPPSLDETLADQAFQNLSAEFRSSPGQDVSVLLARLPPLPLEAQRKLYHRLTIDQDLSSADDRRAQAWRADPMAAAGCRLLVCESIQ